MAYCKACIEKELKIAELKETITGLQAKLRSRERKEEEGYFGANTPSSRVPFKKNASEEGAQKKGGAAPGHTGHGRISVTEATADAVIDRDAPERCPDCGTVLVPVKKQTNRTVIDSAPREPKRILYSLHHSVCPDCKKEFTGKAPVLPRSLYGNHISAQAAVMHSFQKRSHGENLCDDRCNLGSLVDLSHRVGRYFEPVIDALKQAYRQDEAKHADETG